MDRPYATAEQYERWFVRDCARCGRRSSSTARWPDGRVCRTCQDRAFRAHGRCPGCGDDRVLTGRRTEDQGPICTSCAGFSISYACAECGQEGKLHAGRRCTRCTFTRRVAELLDDGRSHPPRAGTAGRAADQHEQPAHRPGLDLLPARPPRPGR